MVNEQIHPQVQMYVSIISRKKKEIPQCIFEIVVTLMSWTDNLQTCLDTGDIKIIEVLESNM